MAKKLEQIDTAQLPVVIASKVDPETPYYELITRKRIFRGKTLSDVCAFWHNWYINEQEDTKEDISADFMILTISAITPVNGEFVSFSIN